LGPFGVPCSVREKRYRDETKNSKKTHLPFSCSFIATNGILSKVSERSVLTEVPFGSGPVGAPRAVGETSHKENKKQQKHTFNEIDLVPSVACIVVILQNDTDTEAQPVKNP